MTRWKASRGRFRLGFEEVRVPIWPDSQVTGWTLHLGFWRVSRLTFD